MSIYLFAFISVGFLAVIGGNKLPDAFFKFIKYTYWCLRYGIGYAEYYKKAEITKFDVCGVMLKRHNNVMIFERSKQIWIKGKVVGLTLENYVVLTSVKKDLLFYLKDMVEPGDVIRLPSSSKEDVPGIEGKSLI